MLSIRVTCEDHPTEELECHIDTCSNGTMVFVSPCIQCIVEASQDGYEAGLYEREAEDVDK